MSGPLRDRPEGREEPRRDRPPRPREAPGPPGLLDLQQGAGNMAVASLFAQRQGAGAGPAGGAGTVTAPAPAAGAPRRVLRRGSTGAAVRDLQGKLNRAGASPPLVVDGIFGPLTQAATKAFQRGHGLDARGVVGPLTWAALDGGPAPPPPPVTTHPTVSLGDQSAEVGILQQKLNATVGGGLPVTGVFDLGTQLSVLNFQLAHIDDHWVAAAVLSSPGVVGPATWVLLDKLAPGGGVVGGVEEHVEHPGGGHSAGVPVASLHPKVGPGLVTTGPAVEELQQKLNAYRAKTGMPQSVNVDANFTSATGGAVWLFQFGKGLSPTGIADDATWNALDAEVPVASVGFVERQWGEEVGGHHYQMTGASASRYSWRLTPTSIDVTAKVNFLNNPPNPQWPVFVGAAWNIFKAVEATSGKEMLINFNLLPGTGPDAHDVKVVAPPAQGRADAGTWYFADPNAASTVPHEFGHLVGLRDEYQQSAGDYTEVTGHEATVGQVTASDGASASAVAVEQLFAVVLRSSRMAFNSVSTHGITPGAFAQQVVLQYKSLSNGSDLVVDLDKNLPADPSGGPLNKYDTIQAFTYSSGSLMGDPSRSPDPHDHGVQPRHVMEFVELIQASQGGKWKVLPR